MARAVPDANRVVEDNSPPMLNRPKLPSPIGSFFYQKKVGKPKCLPHADSKHIEIEPKLCYNAIEAHRSIKGQFMRMFEIVLE